MTPQSEIEVGIKIEHEHAPTLKKIIEHYKEHNDFPDINLLASWITEDHISEFENYYNSIVGLPQMEKSLKILKEEIMKIKEEIKDIDGVDLSNIPNGKNIEFYVLTKDGLKIKKGLHSKEDFPEWKKNNKDWADKIISVKMKESKIKEDNDFFFTFISNKDGKTVKVFANSEEDAMIQAADLLNTTDIKFIKRGGIMEDNEFMETPLDPEKEQLIKDFVMQSDNLDDENAHVFYNAIGVEPEEAEEVVYELVKDLNDALFVESKKNYFKKIKESKLKEEDNLGFKVGDTVEYSGKIGKIVSFGNYDEDTKVKFDDGEKTVDIKKLAFKESKIDESVIIKESVKAGSIVLEKGDCIQFLK